MHALSCREHNISELSHGFLLDPSTLVPAVDALERKGFVKRGKDPSNPCYILTQPGVGYSFAAPP